MRTLFLQMFLAFWMVTLAIFAAATLLNPNDTEGSFENLRALASDSNIHLATAAVEKYQDRNCEGVRGMSNFSIFDISGRNLCETTSKEVSKVVVRAATSHKFSSAHIAGDWIVATPSGPFVVVHRIPYARRPFFPPLPPVALPVSLVVTLILAFILTRPVRALSAAFQKFADGDLSVRLPVDQRRWDFMGGADVHSLMADFNYMAERISSSVEAQQLLIRDVSHELRSPLARLRLALEMAREATPATSKALDQMELEAERLNDLIGQMLTLSLMETTGELKDTETVDMQDLIESMLPDLEFEAQARPCTIHFLTQGDHLSVLGDAELLRRALENVVRNAIRFTAQGTSVEIMLRELEEPGDHRWVLVDIADRGPGVPEETLPLLFHAFYRTDMARQEATGGFGVGLSIAERSVSLHKGTIEATNRTGGGLVLSIRLPGERLCK